MVWSLYCTSNLTLTWCHDGEIGSTDLHDKERIQSPLNINCRTENLPLVGLIARLWFKISSPNLAIRQKWFRDQICLLTKFKMAVWWRFTLCECFYARQHAIARICHANSVCPSHACIVSKRLNVIIEILSPPDRPIILVFRHRGSLRKSDGFTPNGGAKYKGGSKN